MNLDEFRSKYPQYDNVSDRQLTDSLYQKHYSNVDRNEFNRKFLDKEDGSFYSAVKAQNRMRGLYDEIAKTEEGSTLREELTKDLAFESDRMQSLMTPFSESPGAFIYENAALGLKSFLAGAATGAAVGGSIGAPIGGVGAVPGATLGGFLGGLTGVAYDSYNIWQSENLARNAQENGFDVSDEDIQNARKAAIGQAGIETAFSAVPVGGALTKAFGSKATGTILKEVGKSALVAGSTEAAAGGLNQAIQRAVIPGLEVLDEEGVEEIFSTAAASFAFGAVLGPSLDITANSVNSIIKNGREIEVDPAKRVDDLYQEIGEGQEDYQFKKDLRERLLKEGLTEDALEEFKRYNAPRSDEGAEIQSRLEGLFKTPEQRLRLRRMDEERIKNIGQQVEDAGLYDDLDAEMLRNIKRSAFENSQKRPDLEDPDLDYVAEEDLRAEEALASIDNIPDSAPFAKRGENVKKDLFSIGLSAAGAGRSNPSRAKALQFFKIIEDSTEGFTFRKLQRANDSGLLTLQERNPQLFNDVHNKMAEFRAGDGYVDENGLYRYQDKTGAQKILTPEESALAKKVSDFYKADAEDFRNLALNRLSKNDSRIKNADIAQKIYEDLDPDSDKAKSMREDYENLMVFENYLKRPLYLPFRRFGKFVGSKVGDGFYTLEIYDGLVDKADPRKISIGDGQFISKKDLEDLRARVREEQDFELDEVLDIQNVAPRDEEGKLQQGVFFRPTKDLLSGNIDDAALAALATELEGVSPEAANFARELGDNKEMSRVKRMFRESRDVPGYSKDWERVFRDSLQGRSHSLANYLMNPAINKLKAAGDQTTKNYIDYVQNGDRTFTPIRIGSALAAFGLNFSTASLNLTTGLSTGPLAMGIYTSNYPAQIAKIYPKMGKTVNLFSWRDGSVKLSTKNLEKALGSKKRAEQARRNASILFQNTTMEIKSKTVSSTDKFKKVSNEVSDLAFAFMRNTELASRLSIWETALDDLERMKARNPKKFETVLEKAQSDENLKAALESKGPRTEEEVLANYVVERAHGIYGAHGRSWYQRGVGSVLFPFTTYVQNAMELYVGSQFDLKNPRKAAMALGTSAGLAMAFGLQGLPAYQIMEPVWQAYDKLVNGKQFGMARNDIIITLQNEGVPNDVIEFLVNGAVGQGGVDVASRVGVGNPYSGGIKALMTGDTKDIGFVSGVVGNIVQEGPLNPQSYTQNITTYRNLENMAQQLAGSKGYETRRGETIIPASELDVMDVLLQGAGYRPMKFTEEMSIKQEERRGGPGRYRDWEMTRVDSAFKAYKKYVETGDSKYIDKIEDEWEKIVERYQKEGHGEYLTSKKHKAFWDKLVRLQNNFETGASITKPSDREQRRGQRIRDVYEDN